MGVIIIISVFLGILQSILFWEKEPGISVFIFTLACIIYLSYVLVKNKKVKDKKAFFFVIPIILLSSTYFLFDQPVFPIINAFVIVLLTIAMCIFLCKPKLRMPQFFYQVICVIVGAIESIEEVIGFFKVSEEKRNDKSFQKMKKIAKAILISLPVILVVLILLMSADEIFKQAFQGVFSIFEGITSIEGIYMFLLRLFIIVLTFFLCGGFLINLVKENTMFTQEEEEETKKTKTIESLTINTILTILNVIYFVFSVIQFTNLFTQVGNQANFDYASYARQGFFQLMFVSIINFAILFIANLKGKEVAKKKYTKFMSFLVMIFTIIIIFSAFYRMNLYQQTYGYTHLRILIYFVLATELVLIIPTLFYLAGKKINMLKCSLVITSIMYVILNFINIDATIAKENIDRYFEQPENTDFDLSYLVRNLGTDAIPEMERLLDAQNEVIVERTQIYLKQQKAKLEGKEMSWQEYNVAKIKALEILDQYNFITKNNY